MKHHGRHGIQVVERGEGCGGGMLSRAVGPQPLCPCRVTWAAFITTALVNVRYLWVSL